MLQIVLSVNVLSGKLYKYFIGLLMNLINSTFCVYCCVGIISNIAIQKISLTKENSVFIRNTLIYKFMDFVPNIFL